MMIFNNSMRVRDGGGLAISDVPLELPRDLQQVIHQRILERRKKEGYPESPCRRLLKMLLSSFRKAPGT
jgi:hypothetical protein